METEILGYFCKYLMTMGPTVRHSDHKCTPTSFSPLLFLFSFFLFFFKLGSFSFFLFLFLYIYCKDQI